MTKELKADINKIAKFMGYKYIPWNHTLPKKYLPGWHRKINLEGKEDFLMIPNKGGPSYIGRTLEDLGFHSNWDSLMKVVISIEGLKDRRYGWFHVHIDNDSCTIKSKNITKEEVYSKTVCVKGNKFKAVFESVLLFIHFWETRTSEK